MKDSYTLYEEVQILMAGVRLFQHREKRFPSLKELAEFTRFSTESVHHLCNRLEKIGAVKRIRGAFEDRVCLTDPLKAEAFRNESDAPDIGDDLRKWKEQRESALREVERLFSGKEAGKEREERFAQIERKIQKGGKEDRKSPLDALFGERLGRQNKK